MRKDNTKVGRDLCMWPLCQEKAVGGKATSFKNNDWIFPLYCPEHGPKVRERRNQWVKK